VLIHQPGKTEVGPEILNAMFQLRYCVFKERLNWVGADREHLERDAFDDLAPTYLIVHSDREGAKACWRLLPTTGPYMLKNLFAELLDGQPAPSDARVWEISRFAATVDAAGYESLAALSDITSTMLVALLRFGLANRIDRVVAAADVRFERILRRAGLRSGRFGRAHRIGECLAVAGWTDVSLENLALVEARRGALLDAAYERAAVKRHRHAARHRPQAVGDGIPLAAAMQPAALISSPL